MESIVSDAFEQEDTGGAANQSKKPGAKEDSFHHTLCYEDSTSVPSSAIFGDIPAEIIHHIMRFLSPQDLVSCSSVCKLLCQAASDESLWRRLCCMRWGSDLFSYGSSKYTWKNIYFQCYENDMSDCFVNRPAELHEYFFQMQVALRSQSPHPSQVNDDHIILDITIAYQLSDWISSRGSMTEHICSGWTCAYQLNGNIFICVNTGRVHVCDESSCEYVGNQIARRMLCPISFRFCRSNFLPIILYMGLF